MFPGGLLHHNVTNILIKKKISTRVQDHFCASAILQAGVHFYFALSDPSCQLTRVSSVICHDNDDDDTWGCLESPGTAETPPARQTPVSGSLGNTVFMPRVTCPRSRQTRRHGYADSLCLEAVCCRVCSVYLVMTAARLLQSVSTAVSAAGDCMGRATQLLAGARELTATARNENPSRDRQSSLSDGQMQQSGRDFLTRSHCSMCSGCKW